LQGVTPSLSIFVVRRAGPGGTSECQPVTRFPGLAMKSRIQERHRSQPSTPVSAATTKAVARTRHPQRARLQPLRWPSELVGTHRRVGVWAPAPAGLRRDPRGNGVRRIRGPGSADSAVKLG
jgi:hypothetical protein